MPAPIVPAYQDGLTALGQLTATCLNTGVVYICHDAAPTEEGVQKLITNQAGNLIGSDTRVGAKKDSLNLQLALATDALPRPSYIFLNDGNYFVAGTIGAKKTSGMEIKFSVAVVGAVNPIISTLLSSLGQYKTLACTHAVPIASFPNTAVNVTGAVTWAATGLPAGLAINAATGAITGTVTDAGTSTVTVTATDGTTGLVGFGTLAITAA